MIIIYNIQEDGKENTKRILDEKYFTILKLRNKRPTFYRKFTYEIKLTTKYLWTLLDENHPRAFIFYLKNTQTSHFHIHWTLIPREISREKNGK